MNEPRLELYRRWYHFAKPYFYWQFLQFKPYLRSRIADIGCGLGNLTDFMSESEVYVGVDNNWRLLSELRSRYVGKHNVEFIRGDITGSDCISRLKSKSVETVLCVNVLEHIEDDGGLLKNLVDILPPNGTLCLLVPAFQSLYGTLDSMDGHLRRY